MSLLRIAAIVFVITPVFRGQGVRVNSSLIAHEWGTFTSVAGPDGSSVQWAPLSGPPDLPCFVDHLSPHNLKLSLGLVRMETPVLYFYSQRAVNVSVHVEFPQGWITEWYPKATRVQPEPSSKFRAEPDLEKGQIDWDPIQLSPGMNPDLPLTTGESRYFAARKTDSTPLQIAGEQEKFIFYRGMGNFAVPLEARFGSDEKLEIRNAGSEPIPLAIVFERRGDRVGYQFVRNIAGSVELDAPALTETLENLQQQMSKSLIESGLYEKEAAAMIATWQDSWFEEGMRVFYIVPRAMIDSVLPLQINPAPVMISRVFVGRVEVLSPAVQQSIETALSAGDVDTLAKFGRFLNPFLSQMGLDDAAHQPAAAAQYLERAYTKVAQDFYSTSCIR